MSLAGHVVCMGEKRNAYTVFVTKPEGTGPRGRLIPFQVGENYSNYIGYTDLHNITQKM
jgi:hypothetical protein